MHPVPKVSEVERKVSLEMLCPYEPGRSIDEVKREFGLSEVIKLASNENPHGPSWRVIDALEGQSQHLNLYPDPEAWALRQKLAEKIGVPTACIFLGGGSSEILRVIADAYVREGDETLAADITFPLYSNVVRLAGGQPLAVPLDEQLQYDLGRLLEAVGPQTRAVFIATPNNPTGRLLPQADLKAFLDRLPPRVLCVLDLAYWEYVDGATEQEPLSLLLQHPNVILVRTYSKAYALAGLRIGYAVASEDVVAWMMRLRLPFTLSTMAQAAGRAALQDDDHQARCISMNRDMRERLHRELERMGHRVHDSQANFVLADVGVPSDLLFNRLLRRGIVVRPVRHPRLSTCIRVTTGTPEQMTVLYDVLPSAVAECRREPGGGHLPQG
jgi:histidinol-phosphate aminotransferase